MTMVPRRTEKGSITLVAMLIIIVAASFAAGYLLKHTLSCFILAFVLAYLLDPFVVFLERKGMKRLHGILILYAFLTVFSVFCVAYIVPFLTLTWQKFVSDLPGYIQKVKDLALQLKMRYQGPYGAQEIQWLYETLSKNLDKVISNIGAGMYATASRMAFNLLNLLLAPILVFFMLFYKEDVAASLVSWLPDVHRDAVLDIAAEINRSMGGFIRGQIMVSAIVAVLVTAALFVLGVDYPILNGIYAGLTSILPFIGVILASLPALFFAYMKYQTGVALLEVGTAFAVIYFLEGYLVKPIVFKESMNLNPLVTILMVMAFGELMGFWGILLAIPLAAAIKIVSEHLRRGDFSAFSADGSQTNRRR